MLRQMNGKKLLAGVLLISSLFAVSAAVSASSVTVSMNAIVNPLSAIPGQGSLQGVTCTSASACVAVGSDFNNQPLVLTGNPATWTATGAKEIALSSTFGSHGSLAAVTCTSATACVAVGSDLNNQPLVLAGNPATWTVAQAKQITLGKSGSGAQLRSISCPSATSCVAVGSDAKYQPLVLAGNPATWTVAQASEISGGGELDSVTCTSTTACVAVGSNQNSQPLVLVGSPATSPATWTANEITVDSSYSTLASLKSVTCVSATSCVAVGDNNGLLMTVTGNPANWIGDPPSWTLPADVLFTDSVSTQGDYTFSGVTCTLITTCTAVGTDINSLPFFETGDPSSWSLNPPTELTLTSNFGSSGSINSIACTSATACVAVGSDSNSQPLVLSGIPASWNVAQAKEIVLTSTFGNGAALNGISCFSISACVAVGSTVAVGSGPLQPVTVAGNPAAWGSATARSITLGSTFGGGGELNAISCTSATFCVGVGDDKNGQPITLSGNPTSWTATQAKEISLGGLGPSGRLNAVSCTSSTNCVAVGIDGNRLPLVLAGNPATWASINFSEVAIAPNQYGGKLTGISCTSLTNCVAVGYDFAGQPIVATGNPSGLVETELALGTFGTQGKFRAVTCTSATTCVAVGDDLQQPLVLAGNPATWAAAQIVELSVSAPVATTVGQLSTAFFPTGGSLASVSCSSATSCIAVGTDAQGGAMFVKGTPTSLGTQSISRPLATTAVSVANFGAVSCVSTACYVGGYTPNAFFVASL